MMANVKNEKELEVKWKAVKMSMALRLGGVIESYVGHNVIQIICMQKLPKWFERRLYYHFCSLKNGLSTLSGA